MKIPFWTICLLSLSSQFLHAQECLPTDNPPGPFICWPLIAGIQSSTAGFTPDANPTDFCGTIENNSWFSFSPCQPRVSFSLSPANCMFGAGLQAAIYDQNFVLVSNCYSSFGMLGTGVITAENLTPGTIYYFMIDGFLGDRCDYLLTATEGIQPPSPNIQYESNPGFILGPSEICTNSQTSYTLIPPSCRIIGGLGSSCPAPNLAAYYDTLIRWHLPPGAYISGSSNQSTVRINWPANFQGGNLTAEIEIVSRDTSCTSTICAGGFGGMNCTTEILPLVISLRDPMVNTLPEVNLCPGECLEVGSELYCDAGHYSVTLQSADGCDSTVVFDIATNQNEETQLPKIDLCQAECFEIAGQSFCETGFYEIHLNSYRGCDSTVRFHVEKHYDIEVTLPAVSICEGLCYQYDGQEYCQSGLIQKTYPASNGCDSIVRFELVLLKNQEVRLPTVELCQGSCWELDSVLYCDPGNYELHKTASNGCDSTVFFEVKILPTDTTRLGNYALCEGACITIGGQEYCEGGVYQKSFSNQFGCDSTVLFKINVRTLSLNLPNPTILHPDVASIQVFPQLTGSNRNLRYSWEGPGISDSLRDLWNPGILLPGMYTLTVVDTILGCEVTDSVEVFQTYTRCILNQPAAPSGICADAPFFCGEYLHGYCSETVEPDGQAPQMPGNLPDVLDFQLNNPKWLEWSPCSSTAIFNFATFDCLHENGLELTVLYSDDCQLFSTILHTQLLASQTVESIQMDNLRPGESYFFLFDGVDGDACHFQIEIVQGVNTQPLQWEMLEPGSISGEQTFCPGAIRTFSFQPPICRVVDGSCQFPNQGLEIGVGKLRWHIPEEARFIGDSTGSSVMVEFPESSFLPDAPPFPPTGVLFTGQIWAEIETIADFAPSVFCNLEGVCTEVTPHDIQISHQLQTEPVVDICENSDFEICGQLITQSTTVVCRDGCKTILHPVQVQPPREVNYGVKKICPGSCFTFPLSGQQVCEPGLFSVPFTKKCGGTETVIIEFYPKEDLQVGPITEICDPFNHFYTVSFDVIEGIPPFKINGLTIASARFISDQIPNGEPYDFLIEDSGVCLSQKPVYGQYDCGPLCSSEAGTMQKTVLEVCGSDAATATHHANAFLDTDDGTDFILHTDSTDQLGQVLNRNTAGSFLFDPSSMHYDSVYYISFVVGTLENGQVSLDDPCLSIAPGQPVVFRQLPQIHISDTFYLTCNHPQITLSAENFSEEDRFRWIMPDGGIIHSMEITVNLPDQYIFEAVSPEGCLLTKTVVVENNQNYPVANAGPDLTWQCDTEYLILDGSQSDSGNKYNLQWTTSDGAIRSGINEIQALISSPGTYLVSIENLENGCSSTDSALVQQNTNVPRQALLDVEMPSCYGMRDGQIAIQKVQGGTPPFWFSFDGGPFQQTSTFDFLQSGDYSLTIKDGFGCLLYHQVQLNEPPKVGVEMGDDITIGLGDRLLLTAATTISPYRIYWWNDLGEEQEGGLSWQIQPSETSNYYIRIEDARGCQATDNQMVIVQESSVYIPNAFSPNGDQKNDFFAIYTGENVEKVLSFRVFDRRGNLVFENLNFKPVDEYHGWNGYFRGRKMQPDVFAYVVEVRFINGDTKIFKGDVTLID